MVFCTLWSPSLFFYSVGSLQWISTSRHNARNLRGHQSEVTLDYAKLYLKHFFQLRILHYFYQQLLTEGQLVPVVERWLETVCDKDHIRMSLKMRCEVLSYVALIYSGEKQKAASGHLCRQGRGGGGITDEFIPMWFPWHCLCSVSAAWRLS